MNIDTTNLIAGYLYRTTGISYPWFKVVKLSEAKTATKFRIFYNLSFLPIDEYGTCLARMTGFLDQYKDTPLHSSLHTGYQVGDLSFSRTGKLLRGLSQRQCALIHFLKNQFTGAIRLRFVAEESFDLIFPHDFGGKLLRRLCRIEKALPEFSTSKNGWNITIGSSRVTIDPYEYVYRFEMKPIKARKLLGLSEPAWLLAKQMHEPCLFYAFDHYHGIFRHYGSRPGALDFIPDRLFMDFFEDYEKIRTMFMSGRRLKSLPALRLPAISTEHALVDFSGIDGRNPVSSRKAAADMIDFQHKILRSCVTPEPITIQVDRRAFQGIISAPDPYVYSPMYSDDHFANAMAISYFDGKHAKQMIKTGFDMFMKHDGDDKGTMGKSLLPIGGQFPYHDVSKLYFNFPGNSEHSRPQLASEPYIASSSAAENSQPMWALFTAVVYHHTRDREFLKICYPFLLRNYRAIRRQYFRDKPWAEVVKYYWNDYAHSLPGETRISIGYNAAVLLNTKVLAWIAGIAGDVKIQQELLTAATAHSQALDEMCWDEKTGFYFDGDSLNGNASVYGRHAFYHINNLLPLAAGIPDERKARRMFDFICSSAGYGKYPLYTSDLSGHMMDRRGLMAWAHTNWLVLIGLRSYGFHKLARKLSGNYTLALLRLYQQRRSMPEALDVLHALDIAENTVMAGIGCGAFAELFARDYLRDEYICLENQEVKFNYPAVS